MLKLALIGDKVLKEKCEPVKNINKEVKKLTEEMFSIMRMGSGLGLAAPQVGKSKRFFIIDMGKYASNITEPMVCINPEITQKSRDFSEIVEGCLSIPYIGEKVKRHRSIRLKYQDIDGNEKEEVFSELEARVIQHEYDHLDGKLFIDEVAPNKLKKRINQIKENGIDTTIYNKFMEEYLQKTN